MIGQSRRKNRIPDAVTWLMGETYSAFGLTISAGFPLPGMRPAPADPQFPTVELELVTPADLDRAPRAGVGAAWRGTLGDGGRLLIEWGRDGDLLFDHVGHARYLLSPGFDRLLCAPAALADLAWQWVLLTRILPNLAIANGLEALHASAVETDRGVVAIAAGSGGGKTTLALELAGRGHRFFADDTVTLAAGLDGGPLAFPAAPFANLLAPGPCDRPGATLARFEDEEWVEVDRFAAGPARLGAVVLLDRAPGALLGAWPMTPSPLTLAPLMLGLPDDGERERRRFELYSDLVAAVPILRLTAGRGHTPVELAMTLSQALRLVEPVAGAVA